MADTKVSALTALGGTPATGDRLPVVDVSDTTMAASGTTKYVTYGELTTGLSATGHTHVEADITDLGTYLTDITGESIGDLSDVTLTTPAQGDILYRNATGWVNLPAGTSGQYLQTQGAGANPQWATLAGGGDMAAATYDPATVSEQLVGLTATQTLTNKTLTTPTITLKQGAAPAPTGEGDIQWDTDDNRIAVGDGTGTVTFSNDTTNASTYAAASHAHAASDITSGTLAHERGGIEADISAITTGGILAGTGAGTMGIVSAAGKSDGDVLTLQADGTVAYETPAAGGSGGPRGFTYVVAASDSRDATGADATCDGTADDVEIQAAIDAVNTAGGGTVLLLDGTYEIDASINLKSNVALRGSGREGTTLTRSDTTVFFATTGAAISHYEVRDMTIDGNSQAATAFNNPTYSADYGLWDNLLFENFTGSMVLSGGVKLANCVISNTWCENCAGSYTVDNNTTIDRLYFNTTTAVTSSSQIPVQLNDAYGSLINSVINAQNITSSAYGVVYMNTKTVVSGCHVYNVGSSTKGLGCDEAYCKVTDNHVEQASGGTGAMLYAGSTAHYGVISGNTVNATAGSSNYIVDCAATHCTITNNVGSGNRGANLTGNYSQLVGNSFVLDDVISINVNAEYCVVTGNKTYNSNASARMLQMGSAKKANVVTGNLFHATETGSTPIYWLGDAKLDTSNYYELSDNVWTGTMGAQVNGMGVFEVNTVSMPNGNAATIATNSVVVRKYDASKGGYVYDTTTTASDPTVCGMVLLAGASGGMGSVVTRGPVDALKVDGTTDIAVGDPLTTSTTAGVAQKAASGNTVFAIAAEAYTTDDANGAIDAVLVEPYILP